MSIWNKSQSSDSFRGSPDDDDFIIISQHFVLKGWFTQKWKLSNYHTIRNTNEDIFD